MNVRERIEAMEKLCIIDSGSRAADSIGREKKEKQDETRTVYMVDRDRIIHCKSFRRLKRKTQVYIKTWNDHYRTRLTHTLEVSQIGRTIGRGIGINEDLIEAISLGHDIGHVAFAHSGEDVLNEILPGGFSHNVNSVRVLKHIENDGKGLNLTEEVLDGILHHSGFNGKSELAHTLEGQVVRYGDKIAYVNHDIDDSLRAGILNMDSIPKDVLQTLGYTHGERINTLVTDCIKKTTENIEKGIMEVSFSDEVDKYFKILRNFMFEEIYNGQYLKEEREKAKFILKHLYDYCYNNPLKMPELYIKISRDEGVYQGVADYISGMSDEYCIAVFKDIYIPH